MLEVKIGDFDINLGIVVGEMLKEIFNRPPSQFGQAGTGPLAAFKIQAELPPYWPVEAKNAFYAELDQFFQRAKYVVSDAMVSVALSQLNPATPYYYPGDRMVVIYLPLPEDVRDESVRQTAIPRQAISYLS